jgi:hypothetical protein
VDEGLTDGEGLWGYGFRRESCRRKPGLGLRKRVLLSNDA